MLRTPPVPRPRTTEPDDFWASGLILGAGTLACAVYIVLCVASLVRPDPGGDDARARVETGPVLLVATGAPPAAPATAIAAGGPARGCLRAVAASPR